MIAVIITAYIFGLVTTPAIWLAIDLRQRLRDLKLDAERPDMHARLRDACGDGCKAPTAERLEGAKP